MSEDAEGIRWLLQMLYIDSYEVLKILLTLGSNKTIRAFFLAVLILVRHGFLKRIWFNWHMTSTKTKSCTLYMAKNLEVKYSVDWQIHVQSRINMGYTCKQSWLRDAHIPCMQKIWINMQMMVKMQMYCITFLNDMTYLFFP